MHSRFWWGNLKERGHLIELDVDVRTVLEWIFKKWDWRLGWMGLAKNWGNWCDNANATKKPLGSIKCGNSFTA